MTMDIHAPRIVAVSISESPDMGLYGLSDGHLKEAMAQIALYLLASGDDLAYGGDLRRDGFTKLLLELSLRYRRAGRTDEVRVNDYLAWPVHIRMSVNDLNAIEADFEGSGQITLVGQDGRRLSMEERQALPTHEPHDHEWSEGLTAMRQFMRRETDARILLGGRVEGYKGRMPGVAEEALLSLEVGQPVFLVGGFGGCVRDIAETIGLVDAWDGSRPAWPERHQFERYAPDSMHNGLSIEENKMLAETPHTDEIVVLILKGLRRLRNGGLGIKSDEEESENA